MTILAHLDPAYQTGLLIAAPFFAAAAISAVILLIARRRSKARPALKDGEDLWEEWDRQAEISRHPMG